MLQYVRSAPGFAGILFALVVSMSTGAGALTVIDFDGAIEDDFYTTPHLEDGTTLTVDAGHYDIFADPTGPSGDLTMNLDEQFGGLAKITLTVDGGLLFDAISLDVINPADSPGEYTISAVGNSGSVNAPTVGGVFVLGAGFDNISALVIEQHSNGFFTFDDLTIEVVPEPGTASLLGLGLAGLAARRRGSSRRASR